MIHITYRFNITITNGKKIEKNHAAAAVRRRLARACPPLARVLHAPAQAVRRAHAVTRLALAAPALGHARRRRQLAGPHPHPSWRQLAGPRPRRAALWLLACPRWRVPGRARGGSSPACPGARSSPPARGPRPRLAARQPPPAPGRELREGGGGSEGEGGSGPGGRKKIRWREEEAEK